MKEIPGFPGYRLTEDGRVQSLWRHGTTVFASEWRDLKPCADAKGYLGLTICGPGGKRRKVRIHRLMAEVFLPNQLNLPCVRHLDGSNQNNSLTNIAWGTYSENENDKRAHGTWNARFNGKLTTQVRAEITRRRAAGESQKGIAESLGLSRPTVTRFLNGSTWSKLCVS